MKKYDISYYKEGGKSYYEIQKLKYPSLIIEEQVLAEMVYTLFAEGTEAMMQFLRKEGVLEN